MLSLSNVKKKKSKKYSVIKRKKRKKKAAPKVQHQTLDAILSVKTLIEQNTSWMAAANAEVQLLKEKVAELKQANEGLASKLAEPKTLVPATEDNPENTFYISDRLEDVLTHNDKRPNRDEVNDLLFGTADLPGLLTVNDQFFKEHELRLIFNLIMWRSPTFMQLNKLNEIYDSVAECQFNTTT